jgi:hypothetical protein
MAKKQDLNPQQEADKKVADTAGVIGGTSLGALLGIIGGDFWKTQRTGSKILDMMESNRVGRGLLKTDGAKGVQGVKSKNEGYNESSRSEGKAIGTEVDLPRVNGQVPKPIPAAPGPSTSVKGGPGVRYGEGGTTTLGTDPSKVTITAPVPAPAPAPAPKKKIFGKPLPAPTPAPSKTPKSRVVTTKQIRQSASNPALAELIQETVAKEIERLQEVAGRIIRPVQTAINPDAVNKSINRHQIKSEEAAGNAGVTQAREKQKKTVAAAKENVANVRAEVASKVAPLQAKADAARPAVAQSVEDLTLAKLNAGVPRTPDQAAIDVQQAFVGRIEAAVPERRRLVKERNKLQSLMYTPGGIGLKDVTSLGPRPVGRTNVIKAAQVKWDAAKSAIETENTRLTTEFEAGRAARQQQLDALNKQIGALDGLITPGGKPQPGKGSGFADYTPGMEDLFGIGSTGGRSLLPPFSVADAASEFFKPGVGIRPPEYSPETRYPNGYDPVSGKPFNPAQNTFTGAGRDPGVAAAEGALGKNVGEYGALGRQINKATYPLQNANQQLYAAQNPIPPYRQPMGEGTSPVFRLTHDPSDPSIFHSSYDPMPVKVASGVFEPGRDPYSALALGNPGIEGPDPGTGRPIIARGPLPNAGPSRVRIEDVIDPGGLQRTLDQFGAGIEQFRPNNTLEQRQANLAELLKAAAVKKAKNAASETNPKKSVVARVLDLLQGGAVDPMTTNSLLQKTNLDLKNTAAVEAFTKTNQRAPNPSDPDDIARLSEFGYQDPLVVQRASAVTNAANQLSATGSVNLPGTRVGQNAAAMQAGRDLNFRGTGTLNPDLTGGRTNLSKIARGTSIGSGVVGLAVGGYNLYRGVKDEQDAKALLAKLNPAEQSPLIAERNAKLEKNVRDNFAENIIKNRHNTVDEIKEALKADYAGRVRPGGWTDAKYKMSAVILEDLVKQYKAKVAKDNAKAPKK